MGLDAVELIIKVEESFGISISDEAAGEIQTAGDLLDVVLRNLSLERGASCLTSAASYAVRKELMLETGVSRGEIRPSTPLTACFKKVGLPESWKRMEARSGLKWPALSLSGWALSFLVAGSGAAAIAILGSDGLQWRDLGRAALLAILLLVTAFFVVNSVWSLSRALPHDLKTVGELARRILALNHQKFAARLQKWSPQEVWQAVKLCIVEQVGIDESLIQRDSHLWDELGIS
jgi:hypothetical protein